MSKRYASFGFGLIFFLALPPVKQFTESFMIGQMLVQIPLLVLAGFFLGKTILDIWPNLISKKYNGIAGILLAVFTISFWMLPRSIDASINEMWFAIAKYSSLPLLAGIPISCSWKKLHPIGQNFIWANLVSMFIIMGWLYLTSPVRLCNNYLLEQQHLLGKSYLFLSGLIIISGIFRTFMMDHGTKY
ncbi:hypothetical protein [Calidifontibacillus erzurumensis]|uniref:Uncharacterized protein n=1 Tax=Calidifontibacillus erzurumensis TaxID=2741433 RepID=A0A8J8GES7_9BACI|nr:hypothetical protein [Calidifontibacillus erzurumensis]NSL50930.1 hypothetical protein [Calidifontibacillus erzurumensis]